MVCYDIKAKAPLIRQILTNFSKHSYENTIQGAQVRCSLSCPCHRRRGRLRSPQSGNNQPFLPAMASDDANFAANHTHLLAIAIPRTIARTGRTWLWIASATSLEEICESRRICVVRFGVLTQSYFTILSDQSISPVSLSHQKARRIFLPFKDKSLYCAGSNRWRLMTRPQRYRLRNWGKYGYLLPLSLWYVR